MQPELKVWVGGPDDVHVPHRRVVGQARPPLHAHHPVESLYKKERKAEIAEPSYSCIYRYIYAYTYAYAYVRVYISSDPSINQSIFF